MTQTIEAIFEDGVLKPLTQIALAEHERVHVSIKSADVTPSSSRGAWHWLEARNLADGFPGSVADEVVRQRREE